MLGDIVIYKQSSVQGGRGSQSMTVAASAVLINAGEPVLLVAGASACIPGTGSMTTIPSAFVPYSVSGTGFLGVAETTSTNTASLAGSVEVVPANSQTTYLINAQTPSLINTQAKYDALVGARVLITTVSPTATGAIYQAQLTDSALNGFTVRPLDIFKFPNKVALSPLDGISAAM